MIHYYLLLPQLLKVNICYAGVIKTMNQMVLQKADLPGAEASLRKIYTKNNFFPLRDADVIDTT